MRRAKKEKKNGESSGSEAKEDLKRKQLFKRSSKYERIKTIKKDTPGINMNINVTLLRIRRGAGKVEIKI